MIYKNKEGWVYRLDNNGTILSCLKKGETIKHKNPRHCKWNPPPYKYYASRYTLRVDGLMPYSPYLRCPVDQFGKRMKIYKGFAY